MNTPPQARAAVRNKQPQLGLRSFFVGRFLGPKKTPGKAKTQGLLLTSFLCILVWSGYNSEIDFVLNPAWPSDFLNLVHGLRAFFPMVAALIGAAQLAQRRSLPRWLGMGPLVLLLLYGIIGLASSIFISPHPIEASYWALQYISVIIVMMAVGSGSDPEAHLVRFINTTWACCIAMFLGLLLGIPLLSGVAINQQSSHGPVGVVAYGAPADVLGMAGSRNTGFGRFAGIVVILGLAHLLHDRKDRKTMFIWTPLMVIAGVALVLSQARTSWVSVLIAAAMLLMRATTKWRVPLIIMTLLALPLMWLTGFGHAFFGYLTRMQGFDLTLTGRTDTWAQALNVLLQSPWIGFGFWGDRYFLTGWIPGAGNAQNTFIDAVLQSGAIGFIPFVLALVWAWAAISRFYSTRPGKEDSSIPGEILGIMSFFTIYSITEISFSFYSVGWMVMAPLFAHIQLRAYRHARKRQKLWAPPGSIRSPGPMAPAKPGALGGMRSEHS
jgi:O-antigen ligase